VTRPLSAVFMLISTTLIALSCVPSLQKRRAELKEKLGDEEV